MYVAHGLGRKTTNSDGKPDSARSNGGYCTSKFENSYWVSVESQTLKFMLCRVTLTSAGQKNTRHHMDTHTIFYASPKCFRAQIAHCSMVARKRTTTKCTKMSKNHCILLAAASQNTNPTVSHFQEKRQVRKDCLPQIPWRWPIQPLTSKLCWETPQVHSHRRPELP